MKTNRTRQSFGVILRYCKHVLPVLALCLFQETEAQCVMGCPGMDPPLGIPLDADCTETLTAEILGVYTDGCTPPYVVDILDGAMSLGNTVTYDMVGDTFMVSITSQEGQSCMTAIVVQDKLPPQITCPDDLVVSCTVDLGSLDTLTAEDVMDCSDDITISHYDDLIYYANCDSDFISKYTRTYYVQDAHGNVASCTQMIFLEPMSLEDVDYPEDLTGDDALHCSPPPDVSPDVTGYPTIDGFPIVNGQICNISATYTDETGSLCGGGYKIFRTWLITDWCEMNETVEWLQIIEVADKTPPEVNAPDTLYFSAGLDCTADVNMPPALVTEDCSSIDGVRMQGIFGTINSNGGIIPDLAVGTYQVVYVATNDCVSEGRDTSIVIVIDDTSPIPVCNASVVVPVNSDGEALIYADAFDGGSYDNCGPVYLKVRRMDPPQGYDCYVDGNPQYLFDDLIRFCCEDVGNDNLMVVLRVYDIEPVDGPVSDNYLDGHYTDCMLQVQVQDKTGPSIIAPSDLTISCIFAFDPENLDVFGEVVTDPGLREEICLDDIGNPYTFGLTCIGLDGLAEDNCNVEVSEVSNVNINSQCGTGVITRQFTATDDGGLSSSDVQTITIINYTPFLGSEIDWPDDYVAEDICEIGALDPEDLSYPYNEPSFIEDACDLVTFTHQDIVFDFSNSSQACFKILRTWTVLDWCQYDPENSQSPGIWTRTQVIKVHNTVAPELVVAEEEITVCTDDPDCGPGEVILEASASDDCSGPDALKWTIAVDEFNDNSLEHLYTNITGGVAERLVELPLGEHRVLYSVEDLCGNITTEEQMITVLNCKPPSAKCRNLTTTLMPMDTDGDQIPDWGMVVLWASDLDAGSDHVCGNPVHVAFSDDTTDTSMIFDCDNLGDNEVELWVIDDNGNTDFCIVTVTIQDNFDVCPLDPGQRMMITGNVHTADDQMVPEVSVNLQGSGLDPLLTDEHGDYIFPPMPEGGNYTVLPKLNSEHKKGVSTLDLVALQKHLLGIKALGDPYKIIAGDANRSGTLSAMDIVVLRRLILGLIDTLPNNTSWRFVDAAYHFISEENPLLEVFPESYSINPLNSDMEIDFVGIKVGDLNGSVMNDISGDDIVLSRSAVKPIVFNLDDAALSTGESIEFSLTSNKLSELEGCQLTLTWDPLLIDVSPMEGSGILNASHWNAEDLASGQISLSWTSYDTEAIEDILLTFRGTAKRNIMLHEAGLQVSGEGVTPEGILQDGTLVSPEIVVNPVSSSDQGLVVYQNRPNPFKHKTVAPFVIPGATRVRIEVYNVNGVLVHAADMEGRKGYNEFVLDASQLGASGLYTYTISTATSYRTLRMIVVGE